MKPKAKEPRAWDRRPWPSRGTRSVDKVYGAVGFALTSWEFYEADLGTLFSLFAAGRDSIAARRAYFAVRTFEGRAEMLRAASQAHFNEQPNDVLQQQFKDIIRDATSFSPRRNEIAHGVVTNFRTNPVLGPPRRMKSFALYPSFANFKDRAIDKTPSYCYSAADIAYYSDQFEELEMAVGFFEAGLRKDLAEAISTKTRAAKSSTE